MDLTIPPRLIQLLRQDQTSTLFQKYQSGPVNHERQDRSHQFLRKCWENHRRRPPSETQDERRANLFRGIPERRRVSRWTRGPIKFGYTKRATPGRRISSLQTSVPRKLIRLWFGEGTPSDEAGIHAILAPSRAKGEWFNYTDLTRLAVIVLPIIGAQGLVDLGREGLLTFVPVSGRWPPRYQRLLPPPFSPNFWALTPKGGVYWPDWDIR